MYYVDTSVLISYVFASEVGHKASRKTLEHIAFVQKHKLYASSFTLIEACNTICRKIAREKALKLIEPLQRYVDAVEGYEGKCRFLLSTIINFLREKLQVEFVDEEHFYRFVSTGFSELKIPKVFKDSIDLSYKLNLRIKDLLHLTYALLLSETHSVRYFLTRDVEDFGKARDKIKKILRIEVVLVPDEEERWNT